MDMYQKREQRKKDKAEDNNIENSSKININWDIGTYAKTHSISYKKGLLVKNSFTFIM